MTWIALAVAVAALLFFVLRPRSQPATQAPLQRAVPAVSSTHVVTPQPTMAVPRPPTVLPPALEAFYPRQPEELEPARREALLADLARIPRPPRALHQLVSPEFLASATSTELSELVAGEPVIAAKVMATVNSPLYKLRTPVTTIGQAVTFLGLNSVRGICMRYLLEESFAPKSPELRQLFNELWQASSLAGELCLKLAEKLRMRDPGSMLTKLVLSCLGRFASASLLAPELALRLSRMEMLPRSVAEQEFLGLASSGMTALLLREWALPASLTVDACAVDSLLTTPPHPDDAERDARLALCYLCVRLSERLMSGQALPDLIQLLNSDSPDFHHLKSYLQLPQLARLPEFLLSQDVVLLVQSMSKPQGPQIA